MKPYEEYTDNLTIKIDWLSFTVQKSMTPKGVIEYFGMDIEEFKEEARGLNGYRKQYTHRVNGNNGLIRVLYDGQMGMGVHVDVSGSVIRLLVRKHSSFLRTLIFKTKKILLCFFWLIFAVSQSLPVSTWLSMILHLSSPWKK